MNMLTSDEQQTVELAPALAELLVSQADAIPMRFRLAEGKSTLGSSPSCQIRLGAPSVRPLQCLIICKGQEFTVTRWATGIQLNGTDFTTSPLNLGDVLSIGDVRIELTSPDIPTDEEKLAEISPVALIDEVEAQVAAEVAITDVVTINTEPQLNSDNEALTRLRTANQQTRQRFRRLVGALRELRGESHELDNQVRVLTEQLQSALQTQDRLSAELHQAQAIATERESQIGEELDRAIAELTASYAKADSASQEIDSLRARNQQVQEQIESLTTELSSLGELCHGHEAEKLRCEQLLIEREIQLTQVHEKITELQTSFDASAAELKNQNEALQEQLASVQRDRECEVAELQQGLEASIIELHEQNEALRGQFEELSSHRDRQITELQELYETAKNDATAIAVDRDQRIAEFESLRASLENELASVITQRDQQLSELHNLNESLKHDSAAIAEDCDRQIFELNTRLAAVQTEQTTVISERDHQITELNTRFNALQAELTTAIAERDRELQQLHDNMDRATHELRDEAERLTQQLVEQAAERDRTIAELEQAHQAALNESAKQIEALQQQLSALTSERETQVSALQDELEQARRTIVEVERLRDLPDPEKIELEKELQEVRSERQKIAEERHLLSSQLEDAEKRSKLLEIDVRSVSAEWQRCQNTVVKLQDELLTAQAHAADLDAKLCDFQCSVEIDRAVDSDEFAGSLAAMRTELEHRQQALTESKANSEQLREQLSTVEQELATNQQNVAALKQQIVDLQAAVDELESKRSCLNEVLEERNAQISALKETASEAQQALTAELAERDEYIAELDLQLTSVSNELADTQSTGATRATEFAHQLAELQEAATATENERTKLAATIAEYESRIRELNSTITQTNQSHATELADRDARIREILSDLESTRENLRATTNKTETQTLALMTEIAQWEQDLASQIQGKEALVAAHAAELTTLQEAAAAELAVRDSKIAELSLLLEQFNNNTDHKLSTQQQVCDELHRQLLAVQENASLELARREEQICELTRDLHQTQDQLADCASQGERLAELYRQAQADLAAHLAATPPELPADTSSETTLIEISNEANQTVVCVEDVPPTDDPRDNDTPRLERALATLVIEPELDEASTKTVPFQPESFIDRYSRIFDDETEAALPITPAGPTVTTHVPEFQDIVDDDSAALEAYMANMMRRVRGETSSEAVVPPIPQESATEAPIFNNPASRMNTLTQRVAESAFADTNESVEESLICLNELKQTSQKPPLPTSLLAMRELANSSARQAIAKHRKRRHFEGALSKLLVSGIAGGTAAYMLFTADSYLSTYFLAGCGVAIVSGYWGAKLLGIVLEIIRDGINNESAPAELDDSTDPLPIDGVSH
jgi:chromosome segregation ATPase